MPWPAATGSNCAASALSRSRTDRLASGAIRSTGETVDVGEKYVPQFKAGKEIRERINRAG